MNLPGSEIKEVGGNMLTFDDTRRIYKIGELARELDRSTLTIKKWEESGLIPEAKRDSRGWRYYTDEDIRDIKTILSKHEYFVKRSTA